MDDWPRLLEVAENHDLGTVLQRNYLRLAIEHSTGRAAAQAVGVSHDTVTQAIRRLKVHAARVGWHPETNLDIPSAPGFELKRHSAYYRDGEKTAEWVINEPQRQQLAEQLRKLCDELTEPMRGKAEPVTPPAAEIENELTVYPLGDPHIGMYAWAEESGEDFDLSIATADLRNAVQRLTGNAAPTKHAVIANLGDFFHADDKRNETPRSRNKLDVDTRWPKVLAAGVQCFRDMISCALKKHESVKVINVIGNHDEHSSVALSMILQAYYENEPRVSVDNRTFQKPFPTFEFGKVGLMFAHGHEAKPEKLPGVMVSHFPEMVGRTRFRYWLTGHIHHLTRKELDGCVVESFRSLIPRDAFHASAGYMSGRDLCRITYHQDYGEIQRDTCSIWRVR